MLYHVILHHLPTQLPLSVLVKPACEYISVEITPAPFYTVSSSS
jgi:hypothetical protein